VRGHADPVERVKICSEMRLLSTPLPLIVPFFWALKAVASSLKYWMRAGLGTLIEDLGLAFVNLAATGHFSSLSDVCKECAPTRASDQRAGRGG
jgi:hypothetical protein